jgi:probable rRNA maturation factor
MPTKRTANARTNRSRKLLFTLQTACEAPGLPSRRKLRGWAAAALRRSRARVTVRIVGAREGRHLNKQFRGKDYATNVLTFVYDDKKSPLTGDIALCAPVVAREAREQRKSLAAHYAHLLIHGMLHLQGDDHIEPKAAQAMESREAALLHKLGFADPYAVSA